MYSLPRGATDAEKEKLLEKTRGRRKTKEQRSKKEKNVTEKDRKGSENREQLGI